MALESFAKTIGTATTAERLVSDDKWCSGYIIRAMEDNTGNAYVGGSTIDNTAPDLQPGEAISWASRAGERENLMDIWADVDTSGNGVDIWYRPA